MHHLSCKEVVRSKTARAKAVHYKENIEVQQSHLLGGKRIIGVHYKHGNNHCKNHRDHREPVQEACNEGKGTKDLGKNGQREGDGTVEPHYPWKAAGKRSKIHKFLQAVGEEHTAKKDSSQKEHCREPKVVVSRKKKIM